MIKSPKSNNGFIGLPHSPAILLLITIADTTWRMFIPTIGGAFLGIWFDHLLDMRPIWTIIMIAGGSITALLLINSQIKNLRKK